MENFIRIDMPSFPANDKGEYISEYIIMYNLNQIAREIIYYKGVDIVIKLNMRINPEKQIALDIAEIPTPSEDCLRMFHNFMYRIADLVKYKVEASDFIFISPNYKLNDSTDIYTYLEANIITEKKNLINYFEKIYWKFGENTSTGYTNDILQLQEYPNIGKDNKKIVLIPFINESDIIYKSFLESTQFIDANHKTYLENLKPCQIYPKCELSYILILINSTNKYIGHALCIVFPEFIEVFDVFIVEKDAGNGKILMNFIVENSQKEFIWLGVMINNDYYKQALSLYSSFKFGHPIIGNTTLGKKVVEGQQFISLLHIKNMDFGYTTEFILDYTNKIKCFNKYIIKPDIIQKLYLLLDDKYERGGNLKVEAIDTGIHIDIDIDIKKIVSEFDGVIEMGTNENQHHKVEVPPGEIMFHTHPTSCYKDNKCYLGWPSAQDFTVVIVNYDKSRMHIVVTCEGLYIINITTFLKDFIDELLKEKANGKITFNIHTIIIEMVNYMFMEFDGKRFNNLQESISNLKLKKTLSELSEFEKQELILFENILLLIQKGKPFGNFLKLRIDWFIKLINNLTFSDLIKSNINNNNLKGTDFQSLLKKNYIRGIKIFNFSYTPWETIGLAGKFKCICNEESCAIDSLEEKGSGAPVGFTKSPINLDNVKSLTIIVNICINFEVKYDPIEPMEIDNDIKPMEIDSDMNIISKATSTYIKIISTPININIKNIKIKKSNYKPHIDRNLLSEIIDKKLLIQTIIVRI